MKKINKLYSWIKNHKAMSPNAFELVLIFISLFVGAVAYDVQQLFNLEFTYLKAVCGFTFFMVFSYSIMWIIEAVILIIYCKVNYHKTPKEFCEDIDFARKVAKNYENK